LPTEDKRELRKSGRRSCLQRTRENGGKQAEGPAYRGQERMEESRYTVLPVEDKREWRKSGRRFCLQRTRENGGKQAEGRR
jgi:hypothetical protein